MLYLVGGCSRSGKSVLAERIHRLHGVPWFPLDALKMGLYEGAPELGVDPNADDLFTADQLWPIVRGLIQHFIVDGRDYLIEGVSLRPVTVAEIIADNKTKIRACFLGYPGLSPDVKADFINRFDGLPNDWLSTMGAEFIEHHIHRCIRVSADLQRECACLDIPYFDTGQNFEPGLRAAEQALLFR
jgi:hypothetical protein